MSKKVKLNLECLKIKSFVTSVAKEDQGEVNAGRPPMTYEAECDSYLNCGTYGWCTFHPDHC